MCVTKNQAELSNTKLFNFPHPEGRLFIYQNVVESEEEINALIFALPGPIKQVLTFPLEEVESLVSQVKNYLNERTEPQPRGTLSKTRLLIDGYTVSYSNDPRDLNLNEILTNHYLSYPEGFTFISAEWTGINRKEMNPLAFIYDGQGYFPTFDSHDGEIHEKTTLNHQLFFEGTTNTVDSSIYKGSVDCFNYLDDYSRQVVTNQDYFLKEGKLVGLNGVSYGNTII